MTRHYRRIESPDDRMIASYSRILGEAGDVLRAQRVIIRKYGDRITGGRLPREIAVNMYPIPENCRDIIQREARRYEVDPFLIAGVILQESGFDPAALSINLAAGYMQIMPELFNRMSKEWDPPIPETGRFNPNHNIRAGVNYLSILLKRYDGNISKALAAYNAGEHRVDMWQEQYPDLTEEEWVEHIPFQQTRLFVKKIIENYHCYTAIYNDQRDLDS